MQVGDARGELVQQRLDLGGEEGLGHVLEDALEVVLDELEDEEDVGAGAVPAAADHHLLEPDHVAVPAVLEDLHLAQARDGHAVAVLRLHLEALERHHLARRAVRRPRHPPVRALLDVVELFVVVDAAALAEAAGLEPQQRRLCGGVVVVAIVACGCSGLGREPPSFRWSVAAVFLGGRGGGGGAFLLLLLSYLGCLFAPLLFLVLP